MRLTPVSLISIPFILGIFFANFVTKYIFINIWILIVLLVVWTAILICLNKKQTNSTFTIAALLFAFLFGFVRYEITSPQPAPTQIHQKFTSKTQNNAESIITAMTTGDKSGLTQEIRKDYARAGVSHILALSGFHLTVIYCILQYLLLGKIIPFRWRWISNCVILFSLWAYAYFTHFPPSLVRATIMISLFILSNIMERDSLSINTLALAAIIMLIYNPSWLMNVGFQLSFISVLGIIICTNLSIVKSFYIQSNILKYIWGIILITIICSIFTAPLVAYYFGSIPTLGLISNLCVSCLTTLILFGSAIWLILRFIVPALAIYLHSGLLWITEQMNTLVKHIAAIDWAVIEWHPNLWGVFFSYLSLMMIILLIIKITPESN